MKIVEGEIEYNTKRVLYINRDIEFLVKIYYSKKFCQENDLYFGFSVDMKVTQVHSRYLHDKNKRNRIAFENDIGRYGMWKNIKDILKVEIVDIEQIVED